jgi:acyl-coenzyme A synthetase/AMP-(fatty) acid ligase
MRIFKSQIADPPLPQTSLFQYVFPQAPGDSPLTPPPRDAPAFIDGLNGKVLTRGELEDSALRLAGGLAARGIGRGQTALLIGPNSLSWIIAAFGLQAGGICVSPANTAL